MTTEICLFWFRRDLRLQDNAGLYHALRSGIPVLPIFIFDTNILDALEQKADKRVQFIHDALCSLQQELTAAGSTLHVLHGTPMACFKELTTQYSIQKVYTNHDYEPYAAERDNSVATFLREQGIGFHTSKDQVIFEKGEVLKDNGAPYTVFTPYSRKWKEKLNDFYLKAYPTEKYRDNFVQMPARSIPDLYQTGFVPIATGVRGPVIDTDIISHYHETRDIPAINGTSKLSVHLRFGTVSIRKVATIARKLNETFLNELIWRDFYHAILWHYPHIVGRSFKKEYDRVSWRNNEREFDAWCNGQTGYPIVDAGMRQLNETGYMHNRVRMVVASFLTKHLLIDWRWGEAYFAEKLLDYDLAANNGGWQWAAGSGCDAAPYFRVFNPYLQTQKFDPELKYIRRWVSEFEQLTYPQPIVVHEQARERCLAAYKKALA